MKNTNDKMKTILAIVLVLAMAAIVTFQFGKLFTKPVDDAAPPSTVAQEGTLPAEKPAPAGEAANPAAPEGEASAQLESGQPAEGPAGEPTKQPQGAEIAQEPEKAAEPATDATQPASGKPVETKPVELPKISFMDEKIDKAFANSRFFKVNKVLPSGNPFQPPAFPVPMRKAPGIPGQLPGLATPGGATPNLEFKPPSGKIGEIPILPLPGETLGEPIRVTLTGISQSGDNATALFTIGKGTATETVMAHSGWIIGNDYVFVGAVNGKAKVFDRKTNRVIQLATGETI